MVLLVPAYAAYIQRCCTWGSPWLWAACCLPKPQPGHLASLNRACVRDRNIWEDGRRWKRGRRDTTADNVWWHALGGHGRWQREGCSEGMETTDSIVWDRCTLKVQLKAIPAATQGKARSSLQKPLCSGPQALHHPSH